MERDLGIDSWLLKFGYAVFFSMGTCAQITLSTKPYSGDKAKAFVKQTYTSKTTTASRPVHALIKTQTYDPAKFHAKHAEKNAKSQHSPSHHDQTVPPYILQIRKAIMEDHEGQPGHDEGDKVYPSDTAKQTEGQLGPSITKLISWLTL